MRSRSSGAGGERRPRQGGVSRGGCSVSPPASAVRRSRLCSAIGRPRPAWRPPWPLPRSSPSRSRRWRAGHRTLPGSPAGLSIARATMAPSSATGRRDRGPRPADRRRDQFAGATIEAARTGEAGTRFAVVACGKATDENRPTGEHRRRGRAAGTATQENSSNVRQASHGTADLSSNIAGVTERRRGRRGPRRPLSIARRSS